MSGLVLVNSTAGEARWQLRWICYGQQPDVCLFLGVKLTSLFGEARFLVPGHIVFVYRGLLVWQGIITFISGFLICQYYP